MDDMGDMGGTSMTSTNVFQATNIAFAQGYWYFVAAAVALLLLIRIINYAQNWLRLRTSQVSSVQCPTRPTNWFLQTWATLTAVGRELSYPQLYVPIRYMSWMTPPPMGRVLVLLVYWAVIIYMMARNVIVDDAYYWERIGYRNAWVTVTQVPLLYLLASKTSIIGLIAGTSYERLNWLHRWVARTMFVTATVHGWHFWTEWVKYDIVDAEMKLMSSMLPYGMGAWGILLWITVTSFKPFRAMAYEVFVMQHIIAAVMFLWVVYVHVPADARYNVWFAIAAICFDRVCRLGLLVWQNIKLNPKRTCCTGGQRFGHQTQISRIGDSTTVLTIKDVHFKWTAGQHLYLWLPRVGAFETHPYTIASSHPMPETCICNSIQLVVRSHSGFSKRLNAFAQKLEASDKKETVTSMVVGPYGRPPRWDAFETLVLISASTGASYTLPILESVLQSRSLGCTKRVDFLLIARQGEEVGFYHQRLRKAIERAQSVAIELAVHVAVTGSGQLETISAVSLPVSAAFTTSVEKKSTSESTVPSEEMGTVASGRIHQPEGFSETSSGSQIHHSACRPDIAGFVRRSVEATGGETGVVVCGGQSLVAKVRTSIAKLSDERAVHKGTGAQGIHLHVEEYCF
ncbi:Uu.00g061920.m01.CDS01 [Anthostomella pinea]|uniref:ferric-chelate reductase (NADPH) n=1 Tax=Anthostomella pinea TaxID=933095 RepID=A0AAI8YMK0_9PEZI|nr:Uu.00g061920.m01.CDS01 [Anthostomella pinea]